MQAAKLLKTDWRRIRKEEVGFYPRILRYSFFDSEWRIEKRHQLHETNSTRFHFTSENCIRTVISVELSGTDWKTDHRYRHTYTYIRSWFVLVSILNLAHCFAMATNEGKMGTGRMTFKFKIAFIEVYIAKWNSWKTAAVIFQNENLFRQQESITVLLRLRKFSNFTLVDILILHSLLMIPLYACTDYYYLLMQLRSRRNVTATFVIICKFTIFEYMYV